MENNLKYFLILILAFFALFFIYNFSFKKNYDDEKINFEVFKKNLLNSSKVLIVEDIRNVSSDKKGIIMQCGTDLAASLVSFPNIKEIIISVIDDGRCEVGKFKEGNITFLNTTANSCLELSKDIFTFYIKYGNHSTSFFKNKMLIEIEREDICTLKLKVITN